jgi:glycosyltransferase involved in cell wall biosynthesis
LLLPQITEQCCLLIVDNASTVPVAETLSDLLEEHPQVQVAIRRNPVNIGACANVLRCLEIAETEWVWTLSDDDEPLAGCVATILGAVASHPDAVYLNFASEHGNRTRAYSTSGQSEFVEALDSFDAVLFLPSGVLRRTALRDHFKIGYMYAYSLAPHLAVLLSVLGPDKRCYFLSDRLIKWTMPCSEQRWPLRSYLLGIATLEELLECGASRKALAQKILAGGYPSLEGCVVYLIKYAMSKNSYTRCLHEYDQVVNRLYYFKRSPLWRLKKMLYRLIFLAPRIAVPVLASMPAIARRLKNSCPEIATAEERL